MFTVKQRLEIQKKIIAWYEVMGRHDLPWRNTDNLYNILLSEIMLQQTNVPKVRGKYIDFLKMFPDIRTLANSQQSDVLRAWKGLGYNRRALNLHKCAKIVSKQYQGLVPENVAQLEALPGIGPYTSHAVLIFGRNAQLSAVDVNVERVIRRLHGKDFWKTQRTSTQVIQQFVPKDLSRDWHGAVMDFASIICTKRTPKCLSCPLQKICKSFPDPDDLEKKTKKEVGRTENGKHIPRRIFRGRIIEKLREKTHTIQQLGNAIKQDWSKEDDTKWLQEILDNLAKEGMIKRIKKNWQLK